MQLLTHSRADCFKTCRKKHWFAYQECIRPETDARALRMGSAFHDALESLGNNETIESALERVESRYQLAPERVPTDEWEYERETIVRLVMGYQWRWQESGIGYLAAEQSFQIPLINPDTGRRSRVFKLAGKIDGIVQLADGRIAVIEHKLFGEDIGPDAALWKRMRMDHQVSLYVIAARQLGYDIDLVLYDVARKPTIQPSRVPILDDLGAKIVLNASGTRVMTERKEWRQTGDKERGYVLQERAMTAEEWGDKLNNDIADRPDFYFQRQEIPRMDTDLEEYRQELWDIAQVMRDAEKGDRHYRTVNKNTCNFCPYFAMCSNSGFNHRQELPEGFVRVKDPNPELELEKKNDAKTTPPHHPRRRQRVLTDWQLRHPSERRSRSHRASSRSRSRCVCSERAASASRSWLRTCMNSD